MHILGYPQASMEPHDLILLDGGTGTELRERGVEIPCHRTSIWSAQALVEVPDEVVAVHRAFIEAGAEVITACNYAVTPTLLEREGMRQRVEELTLLALDLAERAREESGQEVRIAASLPPLDTSYRADLVPEERRLRAECTQLAQLIAPRVDLILCETMSLGREALVTAEVALETGREVWLSWTLQGNRAGILPSGEALERGLCPCGPSSRACVSGELLRCESHQRCYPASDPVDRSAGGRVCQRGRCHARRL